MKVLVGETVSDSFPKFCLFYTYKIYKLFNSKHQMSLLLYFLEKINPMSFLSGKLLLDKSNVFPVESYCFILPWLWVHNKQESMTKLMVIWLWLNNQGMNMYWQVCDLCYIKLLQDIHIESIFLFKWICDCRDALTYIRLECQI